MGIELNAWKALCLAPIEPECRDHGKTDQGADSIRWESYLLACSQVCVNCKRAKDLWQAGAPELPSLVGGGALGGHRSLVHLGALLVLMPCTFGPDSSGG